MESNLLEELIALLPPWFTLTLLVGVASAALFHLLFGRHFRSLPVYLVLAVAAGTLGQLVGFALEPPPEPFALGEVHLPAVAGAAWIALAVARLLAL